MEKLGKEIPILRVALGVALRTIFREHVAPRLAQDGFIHIASLFQKLPLQAINN